MYLSFDLVSKKQTALERLQRGEERVAKLDPEKEF